MEEGRKHIDDLFREELGNYRDTPGDHVWFALEKRLAKKDDGGAAAPVRSYRWVGYTLLLAALVIVGYFSFDRLIGTAQRETGTGENEVVSSAPQGIQSAPASDITPVADNTPSAENTEEENNKDGVAQQQVAASSSTSYSARTSTVQQQANTSPGYTTSSSSVANRVVRDEPAVTAPGDPASAQPVVASAPVNSKKPVARTNTRRQHNIKVTTTTFDSEPEPAQAANKKKEITSAPAGNTVAGNSANTPVATTAGNANKVSENTNTSLRTPVITNRTVTGANKAIQTKQVQQPITAQQPQNNTAATTANTNAQQQAKVSGNTVAARKENKVVTGHKPPAEKTAIEPGQQKPASSVNTAITNTSIETANKTSLSKTASSTPNKATASGAQALKIKEPGATMAKDNKTEKQITPAAAVPNPGNNKSSNGQDDKTPAGNIKSGQLSLNGSKPGNDEQPVSASALSPSAKQLTSNNNSPVIAQKVKTEPLTPQDAAAKKGERTDTPAKSDVAGKHGTGGGAKGKHDDRKQREKKPSQFEGGLKAGYEFNFAYGNANKYVIAPYVQYYFTPDISMVVQPAFKFGKASVGNVTGSSSYYDIKSSSFNSTRTITTGVASTSTVNYTYNYTQVYDSVLLGYNVGNQQLWDIELPLLLRYNLVPEVAFFLGPTLTYSGRLLQVTEDRMMYGGLTKTVTVNHGPYAAPDTSNPPPGPSPESYSSVLTYNAKPISELEKDKYINGVTKMLSVGYMAGFSFMLADRLMMDVQFQQRFVSNKKVPVQRFKDVYTQPYIRISLGYRLFGDKRKVFGENPE